jgi:hypothetical protein
MTVFIVPNSFYLLINLFLNLTFIFVFYTHVFTYLLI